MERTPEEKRRFLEAINRLAVMMEQKPVGMTYMSVERPTIQKAFALAHKLSRNPDIGDKERAYFRAIAHLIWKSCGEQGSMAEQVAAEPAATVLESLPADVMEGR